MTDREKAIVMAYTGAVTLTGDKLGVFYDYVAELMGRQLCTHEIAILLENIKHRAFPHFVRICEATEEPMYCPNCGAKITGKPEPIHRPEDCVNYATRQRDGRAVCLGTRELDPCDRAGCKRWKAKGEKK